MDTQASLRWLETMKREKNAKLQWEQKYLTAEELQRSQEEQDECKAGQRERLEDLERQRQVEAKALDAALEREARAKTELARLQAAYSAKGAVVPLALPTQLPS